MQVGGLDGCVTTTTSRFDVGEDLHPGATNQWNTKRAPLSLAEVRAPPSARSSAQD